MFAKAAEAKKGVEDKVLLKESGDDNEGEEVLGWEDIAIVDYESSGEESEGSNSSFSENEEVRVEERKSSVPKIETARVVKKKVSNQFVLKNISMRVNCTPCASMD